MRKEEKYMLSIDEVKKMFAKELKVKEIHEIKHNMTGGYVAVVWQEEK